MSVDQEQHHTLLARQPIFDRQLKVIAYELLYRNDDRDEADFLNGDQATCQVLLNNYTSLCDKGAMKRVPAFINITRELILQQNIPQALNKQIVLEILEDVTIDAEVIAAVAQLKADGFRIALDDFVYRDDHLPLLKHVDIVKVDVLPLSTEQIQEQVEKLSSHGVTLLAEKIETVDKLYECVDMGFKLFQGHFLSKPQIVKGKKVSTNSLSMLELLQDLHNPDVTASDIEARIIKDPVLTYKLLRIVNSAAYSLSQTVESLNQAIVLLGLDQIRKWATLIALSSDQDKPEELARTLLARGRMCEMLAESMNYPNSSGYFMVGMMSEINALLDMDMDSMLEEMPLHNDLKLAISKHNGSMGQVLEATLAYEHGEWDRLHEFDIKDTFYEAAYRHSINWAQDAMKALKDTEK